MRLSVFSNSLCLSCVWSNSQQRWRQTAPHHTTLPYKLNTTMQIIQTDTFEKLPDLTQMTGGPKAMLSEVYLIACALAVADCSRFSKDTYWKQITTFLKESIIRPNDFRPGTRKHRCLSRYLASSACPESFRLISCSTSEAWNCWKTILGI